MPPSRRWIGQRAWRSVDVIVEFGLGVLWHALLTTDIKTGKGIAGPAVRSVYPLAPYSRHGVETKLDEETGSFGVLEEVIGIARAKA
jgi:hypothetical protein